MAALPNAALMRKLRAHIARGGVIAYPTESCFGLGCDPRSRRAVMSLLALKGRPQGKGLILVGADFAQLRHYALPLTAAQWARVSPTWPGPVTWLLPASPKCPAWLRGRHRSIAVRVSAHEPTARLCKALGAPLVSTSANRAGMRPAKSYRACLRAFPDGVLVVPGRVGKRKRPSTILDLASGSRVR